MADPTPTPGMLRDYLSLGSPTHCSLGLGEGTSGRAEPTPGPNPYAAKDCDCGIESIETLETLGF
jgi:hypothetical protein